jgi:hypothetical protein
MERWLYIFLILKAVIHVVYLAFMKKMRQVGEYLHRTKQDAVP